MIRLIISTAILVGMIACASSAPPAAAPKADSVAVTNTSNEAIASSEATASSSDDESVIEMAKVAPVAKTAALASQPRDELICHRERSTGSHRLEKVCRLRSEIDETREETQKVLRRMQKQTGASAPSN